MKTQLSLTLLAGSSITLTKKVTKQEKRKREMDGVTGHVTAFSATTSELKNTHLIPRFVFVFNMI